MHNKTLSLILLGATLSVAAHGGVVQYSTLANWQANGTQNGTLTFEDLTAGYSSNSITNGGFTFSAATGYLVNVGNSIYGPGSGNFLSSPSPLNITGNATSYGLAFNFSCYSCNGTPATITITDSASAVTTFANLATSSSTFIGFWSTNSIANLQISFGGSAPYVAIDNVAYGSSSTPEAATLLLIGSGLGLMARFRRSFRFAMPA